MKSNPSGAQHAALCDPIFVWSTLLLLFIGILAVASASLPMAEKDFLSPFSYVYRQLFSVFLGLVGGFFVARKPITYWQSYSTLGLGLAFLMLFLVLIPGLGHRVNGSQRWLGLGPFHIQASECAKLLFLVYLADYLDRHQEEVQKHWLGFFKPILVLAPLLLLLLKEPDFGAAVVLSSTAFSVLFLAGVPLFPLGMLLFFSGGVFSLLAYLSPYRMARLVSFRDPFAHPFDSGYQLVQSLIALGRGGLTGVGLGESMQKLYYLPEAHNDFLFSILGEEWGLLGVWFLMLLYGVWAFRSLSMARGCIQAAQYFSAYLIYGFALWLTYQACINMGVAMGLFPTKGLTLPFMSYGRSSMLVSCLALGLMLRADYESRQILRKRKG